MKCERFGRIILHNVNMSQILALGFQKWKIFGYKYWLSESCASSKIVDNEIKVKFLALEDRTIRFKKCIYKI